MAFYNEELRTIKALFNHQQKSTIVFYPSIPNIISPFDVLVKSFPLFITELSELRGHFHECSKNNPLPYRFHQLIYQTQIDIVGIHFVN